jgi:hypothetical protein
VVRRDVEVAGVRGDRRSMVRITMEADSSKVDEGREDRRSTVRTITEEDSREGSKVDMGADNKTMAEAKIIMVVDAQSIIVVRKTNTALEASREVMVDNREDLVEETFHRAEGKFFMLYYFESRLIQS